ncbi:MAG: hypothetical protein DRG59_09455 [Deltaproteobacteria bacterium]|nr:MAG: hypothetical protein DRG59_09455 [Deltaproteobacteria bacterium]
MFFNKFFNKEDSLKGESRKVRFGEGLLYLYMIIAAQVLLVFALMTIVVAMGTVLATPLWAVVAAILLFLWGAMLVYRQIRLQWRKVKETLKHQNFSDRNFEISFLGGVVTMKVEHNPARLLTDGGDEIIKHKSQPLLEADPPSVSVASK